MPHPVFIVPCVFSCYCVYISVSVLSTVSTRTFKTCDLNYGKVTIKSIVGTNCNLNLKVLPEITQYTTCKY